MKVDAPSGTAVALARAVAGASGRDLARSQVSAREGMIGKRRDEEIGVMALRGGDVVGDHTVYFLGHGERLELTHRAQSRECLARGALRAGIWLSRQTRPGLYSMADVLGLERLMELGLYVRNMGPQSTRGTLVDCARAAEQAGIDHLWVADHIAIPPDQAEGSGGRYLDPLATLAFLAAATDRIRLGTGVLVLPYGLRSPPRSGWRRFRSCREVGSSSASARDGWSRSFRSWGRRASAEARSPIRLSSSFTAASPPTRSVEAGQPFLFLPRPKRPPIYVGGAGRAVLRRTARFGEGWMPNGGDPSQARVVDRRAAPSSSPTPASPRPR